MSEPERKQESALKAAARALLAVLSDRCKCELGANRRPPGGHFKACVLATGEIKDLEVLLAGEEA